MCMGGMYNKVMKKLGEISLKKIMYFPGLFSQKGI